MKPWQEGKQGIGRGEAIGGRPPAAPIRAVRRKRHPARATDQAGELSLPYNPPCRIPILVATTPYLTLLSSLAMNPLVPKPATNKRYAAVGGERKSGGDCACSLFELEEAHPASCSVALPSLSLDPTRC